MKKMSLVLSIFLLSMNVFADQHHDKGLGAHEHGSLKLDMAVEGKTIELDIDGPAESFVGFEYVPKTEKEKTTFNQAQALWTKDLLTKLFVLDKKLGCTFSEASFKQEIEEHDQKDKKEAGVHSDIEASAKIICAQDLKGQTVEVALKKHYSHIKKLSIDLVGTTTQSIEVKNSVEKIKL